MYINDSKANDVRLWYDRIPVFRTQRFTIKKSITSATLDIDNTDVQIQRMRRRATLSVKIRFKGKCFIKDKKQIVSYCQQK